MTIQPQKQNELQHQICNEYKILLGWVKGLVLIHIYCLLSCNIASKTMIMIRAGTLVCYALECWMSASKYSKFSLGITKLLLVSVTIFHAVNENLNHDLVWSHSWILVAVLSSRKCLNVKSIKGHGSDMQSHNHLSVLSRQKNYICYLQRINIVYLHILAFHL